MDMLLICRDALASSLVGNLLLAQKMREKSVDAQILFVGEALSALCRGTFLWPRELQEAEVRLAMADNAKKLGLPVTGRGEARQLDVWQVLRQAIASGLPMYASPVWLELLGARSKLPPEIKVLEPGLTHKLFVDAKKIIGSM